MVAKTRATIDKPSNGCGDMSHLTQISPVDDEMEMLSAMLEDTDMTEDAIDVRIEDK